MVYIQRERLFSYMGWEVLERLRFVLNSWKKGKTGMHNQISLSLANLISELGLLTYFGLMHPQEHPFPSALSRLLKQRD